MPTGNLVTEYRIGQVKCGGISQRGQNPWYKMPHAILAEEEVRKHYHIILAQAESEEPLPQHSKRGKPKQSPNSLPFS